MEQQKYEKLSAQSPLLDETMKAQIGSVLEKMSQDIWVCAVIDLSDEKCREMGEFLKAFSLIHSRVHLELYEPGENPKLEEEMECGGLYPVTGLYLEGKRYSGISFRGIPGGKEINSFVIAFYNAAGPGQPLDNALKKRICELDKPHSLQVFVSLACHYCAETVILSQHIAALTDCVKVQMTDAGLYPELVEQYQLERVPVMILDQEKRLAGGKNMDEILDFLEEK